MVSYTPLFSARTFFFYMEMRGNDEKTRSYPKKIKAILEELYIPGLQHANNAENFANDSNPHDKFNKLRPHSEYPRGDPMPHSQQLHHKSHCYGSHLQNQPHTALHWCC